MKDIGRALHDAGVPPRFADKRFASYRAEPGSDQEKALAAARAVVEDHRGLVILGSVGTGKTHLAVSILGELAEQGRLADEYGNRSALFSIVPELLDALRRTIRYPDADDPLIPFLSVPLLVLDDLGTEKITEWVLDRLYVLINHRYNHQLVTVATSNYSLNELADRGYERMVSRLCDGAAVVNIDGADERMR